MQPVLIVLFIFLSLFIYSLINDIFINFSIIQFKLLNQLNNEFITGIILGIVKTLLQIIGSIGSAYAMYKLIVSGPSWVMRIVGIEDKGGPITDALTQKLERYSFQLYRF
ncbi:hypothetical protein BKH41_08835 [Helicobacter sp. 12S02232-10]|nr:hypothetical protein BKH41_08835 [Helicobacter sp. 12S02232-10]